MEKHAGDRVIFCRELSPVDASPYTETSCKQRVTFTRQRNKIWVCRNTHPLTVSITFSSSYPSPQTFIHLSYLPSCWIPLSVRWWMDYPCVVSRQLPKLHAHRHNSAGVCLRMCYGCVSMLCWCVQGCCGLNRLFCLLPWKNTRTVILYTQKGKSLLEGAYKK